MMNRPNLIIGYLSICFLVQQVRGFSRAEFKGFTKFSEAQQYVHSDSIPGLLHRLQAASRPQKRRQAAASPALQGILQEYGMPHPAQPSYQTRTESSSAACSSDHEVRDDRTVGPHCPDCQLCDPYEGYRLVFSPASSLFSTHAEVPSG